MRYTPIQIEAIRSGMHYGLSLVVGPPGTGKTDVAIQIINNLYSNFGDTERILLVTHSNQALNDLFEKIVQRDIDERHLLRLGYGYKKLQQNLNNDYNFSRQGRIDYMLNERNTKLQIAQYLAKSLNISGNSGYCYTAETCAHFKNMILMNLWEDFEDDLDEIEYQYADKLNKNDFIIAEFKSVNDKQKVYKNVAICNIIDTLFPFKSFIQNMQNQYYQQSEQSPFLGSQSYSYNKSLAYKYWQYIVKLFDDIKQTHVFELLRTSKDRSQYLLTRQSKIVAMTCTHAAIKRDDFLQYNFEYDTLIMEEAAQVLDIETFIPMVLQKNACRLKRIILIGDHYQLPPIIKNRTFAKYSKLDQSLFHRLIRLGTPFHLLNMQGRCRPNICNLWSWRYPYKMGNLLCVEQDNQYKLANTGFYYDFQLISVNPYLGRGEFQPNPYFYQNLDEAEYVINTFMYMRLLGYPAQKITILTTYNGQKHLLKEIINKKCINDPLFGKPGKISTVDKYQGSQNDYILLSLVRTRSVGYIRDIRRLIVSLSRSKFGLYIFGNVPLFQQCYELKQAFNLLLKRPTLLTLVTNESYPTNRTINDKLKQADYDKQHNNNNNGQPQREWFEIENISHLMHVVNTMANAVRSHFNTEYQQKLNEYKLRARKALEMKRKREQKKVHNQTENDDETIKKKKKKSDKEEMDASDQEDDDIDIVDNKRKESGLDSKEQFDLAAQMALMRSKENMEQDQDDGGDEQESTDDDEQEHEKEEDENIEYESSSSSESDDE